MNTLPTISDHELDILKNKDFLHTKRRIINKIIDLFGQIKTSYQQTDLHKSFAFPAATDHFTGKISKGENYGDLPYVVLDFPRLFASQDDIFTFRTMFWWGNQFSFTLHLSGKYAEQYGYTLLENYKQLIDYDFFICINDSPWQYDFSSDNYIPLTMDNRSQLQQRLRQKQFLKISRRLPLKDFEKVSIYGLASYRLLLSAITQ